jgi:adenosine kinase
MRNSEIVVCGSLAFDHVMRFNGDFAERFEGVDLQSLSASFLAQDRQVFDGGCAGNIAYALSKLRKNSHIFTNVGFDFADYGARLESFGVDLSGIDEIKTQLTAACFILSDRDQRQISFFSGGAMFEKVAPVKFIGALDETPNCLVMISPDNPARMEQNITLCMEKEVKFILDPGQQTPVLAKDLLLSALKKAVILIGNEFEIDLLCKKLGLSREEISENLPLLETRGANGIAVYEDGQFYQNVPAVKVANPVDATGCGDALRGGLVFGLSQGQELIEALRLGAVLAAQCVKNHGSQTYEISLTEIARELMDLGE